MARAALRWSADKLASEVGVAASTIRRLEQEAGTPRALAQTIEAIEEVCVAQGLRFVHGAESGVLLCEAKEL